MRSYLPPIRFYSLDVLRGVASLSVVLSHWPLLILNFDKQSDITSKKLHVNSFLSFFYLYGDYAVFLFFCIFIRLLGSKKKNPEENFWVRIDSTDQILGIDLVGVANRWLFDRLLGHLWSRFDLRISRRLLCNRRRRLLLG